MRQPLSHHPTVNIYLLTPLRFLIISGYRFIKVEYICKVILDTKTFGL